MLIYNCWHVGHLMHIRSMHWHSVTICLVLLPWSLALSMVEHQRNYAADIYFATMTRMEILSWKCLNSGITCTVWVCFPCSDQPLTGSRAVLHPDLFFMLHKLFACLFNFCTYLSFTYVLHYLSTSLRTDLLHFQARYHKRQLNLALVFFVVVYFVTDACLLFVLFCLIFFSEKSQVSGVSYDVTLSVLSWELPAEL